MFNPDIIFFETKALDYPEGEELYQKLKSEGNKVEIMKSNRITGVDYKNEREKYFKYKRILIISKRKIDKFQSCKPSAHYQLPLASGCHGMCEYCYLNTRLSGRPYVRAYINVEEILQKADDLIEEAKGEERIFEGAATSDPLTVEYYTKGLEKSINYFADKEKGSFRFVTKFSNVDSLLKLNHKKKTEIRFSINTERVIKSYEHNVSPIEDRLEAAGKIYNAGYPLGFIVAPVFIEGNWKEEYKNLLDNLKKHIGDDVTFEVISHRFTKKAKEIIDSIYPNNLLPMAEEDRKFKYGQFGYGKYVYTKEQLDDMKHFFKESINNLFKGSEIKYII